MVRKYIRKSQRKSWSSDAMRMAIEAVIKEGNSIRKASMENGVPQATLSRKIHQYRCDPNKNIESVTNPKASNFQTVFTKEQESILCQYITTLENQLVALSGIDIRRLAFQIAEKFKIPHRFNKEIEMAGEDWYRGFLKRNPEISVKKYEHLSEKHQILDEQRLHRYFDLLESTITKNKLKPSDIYNIDETVITRISKYNSKIENIEIDNFVTAEQNKLITAVICISASGDHVPLLLIFPCTKENDCLIRGTSPAAWAEFDPMGLMKLHIFIKWLKKFIKFSKATKNSPILLLSSRYRSYLKNLQVLEITKENGVNILCFPFNYSDKLQPLQYNFLKTLSMTYSNEVMKWLYANPNSILSMNEISLIFGNSFMKVLKVASPVNSFRNTGIWPVDRDIFKKDFNQSEKDYSTNINDFQDTSKSLKFKTAKTEEEIISTKRCTSIIPNYNINKSILFVSQNNSQPYIIQLLPTQQSHIQQQSVGQQLQIFKIVNVQSIRVKNIPLGSQMVVKKVPRQNNDIDSVIIPREAKLSQVNIEDLQNLMNNPKKLYYYVSPHRLNLLS